MFVSLLVFYYALDVLDKNKTCCVYSIYLLWTFVMCLRPSAWVGILNLQTL